MAPTCKCQIVSCDQRSQLVFSMQPRDEFKNHFAGASIEIAGWLIGQQYLRLRYQRAGQCQTLLLAAGEFSGAMVAALLESHFSQPARGLQRSSGKRLPAG